MHRVSADPLASELQLVDLDGVAALLAVSRSTAERLIATTDIPKIDLAPPGARRRHLWRFDPASVLAWARSRGNGNGTGGGAA